MSRGVTECDPSIVCAKLVCPRPACLDGGFGRPDTPFVGAPKAQVVPFPWVSQIKLVTPVG